MTKVVTVQQVFFSINMNDDEVERVIVLSDGETLDIAWTRLVEELFAEVFPNVKNEPIIKEKEKPYITGILLTKVQSIETNYYSQKRS